MAIKFGRGVTYRQKTPRTKSGYILIKWSRGKCKTLYLLFGIIYGHQASESSNLQSEDPTH